MIIREIVVRMRLLTSHLTRGRSHWRRKETVQPRVTVVQFRLNKKKISFIPFHPSHLPHVLCAVVID